MRAKSILRIIVYVLMILVGLYAIGLSLYRMNFVNTKPLVPIRQSQEGDHVKVEAVRLVEVIDKKVTATGIGIKRHTHTTYYSLVEIKDVEGGCMIYETTMDPYDQKFPKEIEGVTYKPLYDIEQKASQALDSHPEMSLYRFEIRNYKYSSRMTIVGIVCVVVFAAFLVLEIISARKKRGYNY